MIAGKIRESVLGKKIAVGRILKGRVALGIRHANLYQPVRFEEPVDFLHCRQQRRDVFQNIISDDLRH